MLDSFRNTYNLLQKYNPEKIEELVYKTKMIEFLSSCEDCFLRSCRVGHFTSSAFLLNREKTHILLMHHSKLDRWMQLGGHCDGDHDVANVAIKEAKEESGINKIKTIGTDIFDLDIHLIPANKKEAAHYHFDIRFLLHAYGDDMPQKNHESKELRWISIHDEYIPSQEISVLRMFEKIRSGQSLLSSPS